MTGSAVIRISFPSLCCELGYQDLGSGLGVTHPPSVGPAPSHFWLPGHSRELVIGRYSGIWSRWLEAVKCAVPTEEVHPCLGRAAVYLLIMAI